MKNEILNNPTAGKTGRANLENKGNNRRKRGNNKWRKEGRKLSLEFGVF